VSFLPIFNTGYLSFGGESTVISVAYETITIFSLIYSSMASALLSLHYFALIPLAFQLLPENTGPVPSSRPNIDLLSE
jgi:hypothetical protein